MPKITLVILAFKFSNELGLVAYTIVFKYPRKKNLIGSNLANVESMGIKAILKKMKLFFYLSKNCCKFYGEELFNNYILKTSYMKLYTNF